MKVFLEQEKSFKSIRLLIYIYIYIFSCQSTFFFKPHNSMKAYQTSDKIQAFLNLDFAKWLILLLAFFLIVHIDLFAQGEAETFTAKNAVFISVGGSALYAVNYDRIFYQKEKLKLSGSMGFSMLRRKTENPVLSAINWSPYIPVEFSAFWGKSNHHLEIGTGVTVFSLPDFQLDEENLIMTQEGVKWDASVIMRIGYRYQKPEGGLFFRVGYTPGFNLNLSSENAVDFYPAWVGLSVGKSF